MTWLAENWFWVLFGLAFIAIHIFGHGGHGGHGSHGGGHSGGGKPPRARPDDPGAAKRPGPTDVHRH